MKNLPAPNNKAILLTRVSSSRQAEGYSLDFQEKAGKKYALDNGFILTCAPFRIIESASKDGREEWLKFIHYLETHDESHILIPKVDRALRNFHDLGRIADIAKHQGKTFHFFHDGLTLHKDSPASDLLKLGIQGSMSTYYSADLAEKTKRGLQEKREQGELPGRAPTGYLNNKLTHKIEKDPVLAPWVVRIFELASMSLYSLRAISEKLTIEGAPKRFHISNIEHILRNPFYYGDFRSCDKIYKGIHEPLITRELYEAAIKGLERLNKAKYRSLKSVLLYNGLMTCGTCNRAIFGEDKKKGKYRLYHCSGRLPCTKIVYVNEIELTDEFKRVIKGIEIPPAVVNFVLKRLEKETSSDMAKKTLEQTSIKAELKRIENRHQSALDDLYDPSTPDDLKAALNAKLAQWRADKDRLGARLRALEEATPDRYMPTLRDLLELSKRAYSLYEKMEPEKKREFLKTICSNYLLREKTLEPIYKKPFDLLAKGSSVQSGSGTRIRT